MSQSLHRWFAAAACAAFLTTAGPSLGLADESPQAAADQTAPADTGDAAAATCGEDGTPCCGACQARAARVAAGKQAPGGDCPCKRARAAAAAAAAGE